MSTVSVQRMQWLAVARHYIVEHPLDARAELAAYIDGIAVASGDHYMAGIADALRVARPLITARSTGERWIN